MEAPYISKLQISKPWLPVFLVDGAWVRKNHNVDFVYGGHDLVYNFIPKREIWLDSSVEAKERPFTLLHELYERYRMDRLGETYDVAHEFAAAFEKKYRKDPTGIHEKIKELFDMNKQTEKTAFPLSTINQMRYLVMPGSLGFAGAAMSTLAAPEGEKARAALEGAALGGLTGLGLGLGHHLGSRIFEDESLPFLVGTITGHGTLHTAKHLFPGIQERAQAFKKRRQAEKLSFEKQAYWHGYNQAQREKRAYHSYLTGSALKDLAVHSLLGAGTGTAVGAFDPIQEKERGRSALWGALTGTGVGIGNFLGENAISHFMERPTTIAGGMGKGLLRGLGSGLGAVGGGLAAGIPAYYWLFGDKKPTISKHSSEQPTRPTHKNPGPVASEPTSPITSTPKQDSTVTSVVSPKTY